MNNQAAQTMPLPASRGYLHLHNTGGVSQVYGYTADQMHQYARDYAAALSQTAGVAEVKRDREGDRLRFPDPDFNAWLDAGISDAGHTVYDSISSIEDAWQGWHGHVLSVMLDENPDLDAMIAAAPAAQTIHPDALPDGTLSKSTAKRVEALGARGCEVSHVTIDFPQVGTAGPFKVIDGRMTLPDVTMNDLIHHARMGYVPASNPTPAASVSERARSASLKEIVPAEKRNYLDDNGNPRSIEDEAYAHGWNACRAATLRAIEQALTQQRRGVEDEDYHVIMSMGRLLAEIAVILKGAEPAGTAWSYHDLPELVASSLSEPRQVAAEMKAWAHTKMAEQQSSRRDRMMVSEWAKRLLPESSFPVKDFDVEGMSITKEAAREAVKRVALEQALTQQRGNGEVVDRDAWAEALELPEGYTVEEFLPGGWHYAWTRADGERMVSGTTWNHPALAAIAAWQYAPDTTPQPSADAVREDSDRLDWIESQIREYGDGYTEPREAGWAIQWQQERPDHYWPGLRAWIDEERRRASGDELESLLSAASGEGVG